MKYVSILVVCSFLGMVIAACSPPQTLQFQVRSEKLPFLVMGPGNQQMPALFIIASPDDIVPPTPVVEYSEAMLESLKEVDFDKPFVILHLVGQIPENGTIKEITRISDTVYIRLKNYSVGPENYELRGFTLPYQITAIEKKDEWGKDIKFILEVEDGDIIAQEEHYIP